MKFVELKNNLQSSIENVYLVRGKDAYLRMKTEDMIVKSAVRDFLDFNVIKYTDDSVAMENVLTACMSMPMMSDKKVVVLRDVVFKNEKDIQALVGYVKKPMQSTVLVIVDGNNANCYKDIAKYAELVDCGYLDQPMVQKVVLAELNKQQTRINADALSTLMAYCNLDLMRIMSEVNKLCNYAGVGGVINVQDVQNLVHKDVEYSVFEVTNAVAKKNGKQAMAIIAGLLQNKEQPNVILMLIQSHIRRMFFAVTSKMTNKEIADALGVKEYAIKISRESASRFSPAKLKAILDLGGELDYKIKAGQMSAENALYFFVNNITA